MAAKNKRRRPRSKTPPQAKPAGPRPERQDKKAAKRQRQEQARKAAARKGMFRRALVGGVVGLAVFAGITWINRAPAPTDFQTQTDALNTSIHAGCSDLVTPSADPDRRHLNEGEAPDYTEHPATSGPHDPDPLPDQPRVYSDVGAYSEAKAVHSLEHGAVIVYYRPSADPEGLPGNVVDALKPVTETSKATYLIPYADLPTGAALAFTAWNKLLTCPNDITADDSTTVANGFIASYECTSNAPEAKLSPC
jgi:hypothetical protein